MGSRLRHLRNLVEEVFRTKSERVLASAFTLIQQHFDEVDEPDLLVRFAEAASLMEREPMVSRTLSLFDRLKVEDNQFKARMLLIRCMHEARSGIGTLYGENLVQQIRYALTFLQEALEVAAKPQNKDRYGFLVYNATLVFWVVVRPACRPGWQKFLVQDFQRLLDALKQAAAGSAQVPIDKHVDVAWRVELALQLAFALEDDGKDTTAVLKDAADLVQKTPEALQQFDWLERLLTSARAYFARGPNVAAVQKDPMYADKRQQTLVNMLFVRNGGLPNKEQELKNGWIALDKGFQAVLEDKPAEEQAERSQIVAEDQRVLALACRACCEAAKDPGANLWPLAIQMVERLVSFRSPPPAVRALIDLSLAETSVWQAINVNAHDPQTGMLLTPEKQRAREVEARVHAVRLCEQCLMAAKRIDDVDLVEEAAIVLWNYAHPLLSSHERYRVHKSLLKASEILHEIDSNLLQLRVQLHLEVAKCEIANDLLTKGQSELQKARRLDNTLPLGKAAGQDGDAAPYLRPINHYQVDPMLALLRWKLSLYEEPSDPVDQAMLLIDQVQHQRGTEQRELGFNLLSTALEKLEQSADELTGALGSKATEFQWPEMHIRAHEPLQPLENKARRTVMQKAGSVPPDPDPTKGCDPATIQDLRPKSDFELGIDSLKRATHQLCAIAKEAHRLRYPDLAIQARDAARQVMVAMDNASCPLLPPVDLEVAIAVAEADYVKGLCLAENLAEFEVVLGKDEPVEEEQEPAEIGQQKVNFEVAEQQGGDEEERVLTAEEREKVLGGKRAILESLLAGMEIAEQFKQWWLVLNGAVHFWNLHLELVDLGLVPKALPEFHEALLSVFEKLLTLGDHPADFDHDLARDISVALMHSFEAQEKIKEASPLIVKMVPLLSPLQTKEVVGVLTNRLRDQGVPRADVPAIPPPKGEAAAAPAAKGKEPPKPASTRVEGEVQKLVELIEFDEAGARMETAKKAADLLDSVAEGIDQKNEVLVILFVELWSSLGRSVLAHVEGHLGAKFALMCAHKALGGSVDLEGPPYAAHRRKLVLGAAHQLAGRSLAALLDPKGQERQSLTKLRQLAVGQFARGAEYSRQTKNPDLAEGCARCLWNVAVELMHSRATRAQLIEPFRGVTQALADCKYKQDPEFLVNLYTALFECYSDQLDWDAVQKMLNQAFSVVPSSAHRRLWALRMLALSRQGRDVVVAMGKMKETQASAQANIWLVLAHASKTKAAQLAAYQRASEILQNAMQTKTVEVRMELADWLLRHGLVPDALDQLHAAADFLLEIEEDAEDEPKDGDGKSLGSRRSSLAGRSTASRKSVASRRSGSRKSRQSLGRSITGRSVGSKAKAKSVKSAGGSSQRSKARTRIQVDDQDAELPEQLQAGHYEMLVRVHAMAASCSPSGQDLVRSLMSSAHSAIRMVESTIQLCNVAVAATERHREDASPFRPPDSLQDYTPERLGASFQQVKAVLKQLQDAGEPELEGQAFLGAPSCFPRPPLTFHMLDFLTLRLEEHGLHALALPVLSVWREFAEQVFPEESLASARCVVDLKLARMAHACNLAETSSNAWLRAKEQLDLIPATFPDFAEELDAVAVQLTGKPAGEWADKARQPFLANDVRAHELWCLLAEELVARGEYTLVAPLLDEALRHAAIYRDARFQRRLRLLKAQVGLAAGDGLAVLAQLAEVKHCEATQVGLLASLLIQAYQLLQQSALAEQALSDAQQAVKQLKQEALRKRAPPSLEVQIAEYAVEALAIDLELPRVLSLPPTSREFAPAVAKVQERMRALLQFHAQQGLHWKYLTLACQCIERVLKVIAALEEVLRDLEARGLDALSYDTLLNMLLGPSQQMLELCEPSHQALKDLAFSCPACRLVVRFDLLRHKLGLELARLERRAVRGRTRPKARTPLELEIHYDPKVLTPLELWFKAEEESHAIEAGFLAAPRALASHLEGASRMAECVAALHPLECPRAKARALVALGTAHVEAAFAAQQVDETEVWKPFVLAVRETRQMAREELYSKSLPGNEREPPPEPEEQAAAVEEPAAKPRPKGLAPPPKTNFLQSAREKLQRVLQEVVDVDPQLAYEACRPLALRAYGCLDQPEAFASLATLQSLAVCLKGLGCLDVMAPTHDEVLLFKGLERMESLWCNPGELRSYTHMQEKLREMPISQRMLGSLGPVPELLKMLPPRTLVVSLQFQDGRLFVAAATSGENPKHSVRRFDISEVDIQALARRLAERNCDIEKEFVVKEPLPQELSLQCLNTQREAEVLLSSVFALLDLDFFELGRAEHPDDPERVFYLPDPTLWHFALESFAFSKRFKWASRDLSLHMYCQRLQALGAGPEDKVGGFAMDGVRLMTDPFAEDGTGDTSMCALHDRLVKDKVVPAGHHGGQWVAQPDDFVGQLQDASAFLFLGLGRFVGGVGLRQFASIDLRHVPLLALLGSTVNDASFRRQTKTDSTKGPAELELEAPYLAAVLASMRGSSCILQMAYPIPIPLAMRAMEHLARQVAAGEPIGQIVKGLGDLKVPEGTRYQRPGDGAEKKAGGKQTPASQDEEPLFPAHSLAAFQLTGLFGMAKK